ncbi:hypothetical protein jhhlp_004256 [Lomentospora prolificans]|uniref:BTB domain-containing protein n=1 Tax=Lomentospora prolificans TaxID=41688 RepID=A0A2N3NB60_9PEZI|nr:hypothetical protein jhhlp_004256 [Lomentospora prolificans]
MPTSTNIQVDPRGDLSLRLFPENDAEPTIFITSSLTLARASSVFDRMLYGEFAEAKPRDIESGEWVVTLPDQKPKPMHTWLNILHGHFQKVPTVVTIDELYDLTVLTNYFDATMSLIPWIEKWMAFIDINDIRSDQGGLMAKFLWIAWEVGEKDDFAIVSRRMLMELGSSELEESFQALTQPTPPDIFERIAAIRIQTCQALLNIFREMADNLIVVDERVRWCRYHTWMGHHRCESMILGSMTFCLTRAGLWPLPDGRELEESVLGLYGKLTTLVIHDIGKADENPEANHRDCNPGPYLLEQVQSVMRDMPSPVSSFHIEHMEKQAKNLYPSE